MDGGDDHDDMELEQDLQKKPRLFAKCTKCNKEISNDQLDEHEQDCPFIQCSSCFEPFDGSGGKVLCSDCVFVNCIHNNANLIFDFVQQNANQQWYDTEWNTEERRGQVEQYLKASGDPEWFYSVFSFCWLNQVTGFTLATILQILDSFPENQEDMMQKHILTLPNHRQNAISIPQTVSVLERYGFCLPFFLSA